MQMEMMNVKTYVLGRDSGGSSDFFETDVSLSRSSYDLGEHYDVAIKRAEEAGYETPMGAFDEFDPAGKALARLQSMQTVEAIGRNVPTVLVWLGEMAGRTRCRGVDRRFPAGVRGCLNRY